MKTYLKNTIYISIIAILSFNACQSKKPAETQEKKEDMKIHDPHSYAKPEEAVMKHLDWDVSIDFENQRISGIASITIAAKPGVKQLILDTKGLEIEKVTLGKNQDNTTFELGEEKKYLGSPLKIKITPETQVVHIYYHTEKGAEALQWLSPMQTSGGKHPFLFTQSQAILARSWIPLQDSPGIRFTYNARVKVPQGLLALMSAENPTEKNENGIYHFTMNQPIPAYLMALAIGDITFKPVGKRTGVYAESELVEAAAYEFGEMQSMLENAEKLYGNYRWERYDVIVLPPSFPFGGMENPRLTFATPTILAGDRSLTSLVAHELAHSWSGNLVTNATWNDFWLNEGFTVYFERRIMESLYGPSYVEMLEELGMQDLKGSVKNLTDKGLAADTRLKVEMTGRNPDDGVTDIPYEKGFFFLKFLENKVGRDKFDAFLKAYFNEKAFKTMTTEAFIDYLNKNLFEKNNIAIDNTIYEQWIYGTGLPENIPPVNAARFNKVDSLLTEWKKGTKSEDLLPHTKEWSPHEWLHFIRNLPEKLTLERMKELDIAFNFTASGNSEILAAWFMHVIRNQYDPSYKRLKTFLKNVGRRKFLAPLYTALGKTNKDMALKIYKEARPSYHFVSVHTIDGILGWEEGM